MKIKLNSPFKKRRAQQPQVLAALKPARRLPRALYALVVLALCAALPLFVSNAIGYAPLIGYVLLVAASFIYLQLLAPRLSWQLACSSAECTRGCEAALTATLRNAGALPALRVDAVFTIAGLDGEDRDALRMRTALSPRSEHGFSIPLCFEHVGVYEVGVEQMEVFDLLGLFSKVVRVDQRCRVRVVPRLVQLERIAAATQAASESKRSVKTVLSDDMDYAYVRNYEMGDPMKTVHWKLSARGASDELFTKLFESHVSSSITVLFDFYSDEPDEERRLCLFDTLLEAGYSVIEHATQAGIDCELVFRGSDLRLHSTRDTRRHNLDLLVDSMPRLSTAPGAGAAAKMLEEAASNPDGYANFYLFTSCLTPQTAGTVAREPNLRRSVRVMSVLPAGITPGERTERLAAAAALGGIGVQVTTLESPEDVWKAGA